MPEHRRDGVVPRKKNRKSSNAGLPTDAGRGAFSEAADLALAREFGAPAASRTVSPQKVLVFDSFSGIAGDMTIAALIDVGAPVDGIREGLAKLPIPSFRLDTVQVVRGGINARHLLLKIAQEQTYQPAEMRAIIRDGALPARAERRALAAIDALERAEAAAHQTDSPHFHEAGGVDAIIDLCGTMIALELLGIEQCWCPIVTVGAGTIVNTEHGPIPAAPGPAAAYILQHAGFALRFVESSHELVTPTGAAILAAVARPGPVVMTPTAHGAGAGTFDPPNRPNALRVFIGHAAGSPQSSVADEANTRSIVELAANIDDMPPSLLAHARDRLMEEGALDAWIEPIGMKKGRAASKLCALVVPAEEARFAALIMRETTTLGVRVAAYRRWETARHIETVMTSLGPVRVKWRDRDGHREGAPEFDDVRALAASLGRAALDIQRLLEAELAVQPGNPGQNDRQS